MAFAIIKNESEVNVSPLITLKEALLIEEMAMVKLKNSDELHEHANQRPQDGGNDE